MTDAELMREVCYEVMALAEKEIEDIRANPPVTIEAFLPGYTEQLIEMERWTITKAQEQLRKLDSIEQRNAA